jgi:hypothetical protein
MNLACRCLDELERRTAWRNIHPGQAKKPEHHCPNAGRSLVKWSMGFDAPAQAEIAEAFGEPIGAFCEA